MADIAWSIRGTHFVNCNCDYGCPCQFNAIPTDGTCRAVIAWQIDEGFCGDVRLDGLLAVNTYGWPGPIHKGNGEMQSIIDERATEDQRRALTSVLQGEGAAPAAIMLQIYRAMCPKAHEPLFKPISLKSTWAGGRHNCGCRGSSKQLSSLSRTRSAEWSTERGSICRSGKSSTTPRSRVEQLGAVEPFRWSSRISMLI